MYTQTDIQEFARKLAQVASPKAKIVLFGSYARGDAQPTSDVDFLVLEPEITDPDELYFQLFSSVRSANIDLILMKEDEFLMRKQVGGCLSYYVAKEGVTLYGG